MNKIATSLAVFFAFSSAVLAFTVPEKPTGYVNDYANVLSLGTKQSLENDLRIFTASTTNEISVVTIPDLGGDTIEHYATKLFESWKIGSDKHDNGILLLIAKDDRKIRIEVGYGLEGALPDILAKDIIDTKITPSFKQGDYDAGVVNGVKAIKEATKGEYVAQPSTKKINSFTSGSFIFFIVLGVQLIFFLSAVMARSKSWWLGGIVGGVTGAVLTLFGVFGSYLVIGGAFTAAFIVIGLIFDYFVSNSYNNAISQGKPVPWWAGGAGKSGSYSSGAVSSFGGGSSSRSSSSFGGFGGGSSGGGGASSSW